MQSAMLPVPPEVLFQTSISIASYSGSQTGSGVDCSLVEGDLCMTWGLAKAAGTGSDATITAEESDDNATWSAATMDDAATITTGTSHGITRIRRTKRYVRLKLTLTGTSPAYRFAAFLLGVYKIPPH